MPESVCILCQIVKGVLPSVKVWENDDYLAINDKNPDAPIHILVVPKKHLSKEEVVTRENQDHWGKLMQAVFEVIRLKKLDKTGYKLVNLGAGYNHFDHEHVHVLGGTSTAPIR